MTKPITARGLPDWLDGRTVAVLTVVVTVGLTLGTMLQTMHARLDAKIDNLRGEVGTDIESLRGELSDDIDELDDRVRSLEIDVAAIRTAVTGLDTRPRPAEEREPR